MAPESPVPESAAARPRLFYGWAVVAVAFVTMGIGVSTRTAFSLLFPPILAEFGWQRAETAGAFSIGFFVGAGLSPAVGVLMDRWGPRRVIPFGTVVVSSGLLLATLAQRPWQLYLTLGVLVVGGSVIFSYIGHSMFLPNWFVRRRGFAIGVAFAGVGIGAIVLFPVLQHIIGGAGWRWACVTLAALLLAIVLPLNAFLQRRRPEDLGLRPDGDPPQDAHAPGSDAARRQASAQDFWTLRRAVRSAPFWWIMLGYFCALFSWYLVQVHQTKYLLETGIDATTAAFALGFVGLTGVVGQIWLGWLSDRIGREWAWSIAGGGFALCYALLLAMGAWPSAGLMYAMVAAQGLLGYGAASVYGAIPAEIFAGRRFGAIFGVLSLSASVGAGVGPWVGGAVRDATGSYAGSFWLAMGMSLFSIPCIWLAAPRKGARQ